MRTCLPIVALVGLTLAAGPVLAQQSGGNQSSGSQSGRAGSSSGNTGASGTTGDLNAPTTQPSPSDTNEGTANQNAAPGGGGNAPTAEQAAPQQPMMQHKHPTRHAAAHHATMAHHATGHHTRMASRGNGPCFPLAMQFDQRLSGMLSGQSQSPKLQQATDMRNKAMEACNAGHTKEGEQQLRQAIAGL